MAQEYFTLLTEYGLQVIAHATAQRSKISLTHMAVGDGGGKKVTPTGQERALVRECYRGKLDSLSLDPLNNNQVVAEMVVSESVGGFYAREIAVFDELGNLFAYGNIPETYKPNPETGSANTLALRVILRVDNSGAVNLQIDPSVVVATRQYVDDALLKKTSHFSNLAGLRGEKGAVGKMAFVSPPSAESGFFYADMNDKTTADNGATVIVAQDGTRWKRIYDELRPEYFGAVGNGVADDTAAMLKAVALARALDKKIIGINKYLINQDVNFRALAVDFSQSRIMLLNGAKLYIGGNARHSFNHNQAYGSVLTGSVKFDPEEYTEPSIICIGAKNQNISIKYTDFLRFWQSTNPDTFPSDASQAYSKFDIGFVIKIEIDCDPAYQNGRDADGAGSRAQWFNENVIQLNRCYAFEMKGGYRHNCNLIIGGSFETDKSYIKIDYGNKNKFVRTRLEGVGYVYFGEETEANILERAYFGSVSGLPMDKVTDLGVFNRLETEVLNKSNTIRVLEINPFLRKFNGFTDKNRFRQVSRMIKPTVAYGFIASSEEIKMQGKKDILLFDFDGVNSRYAIEIFVFDDKGKLLNANQIKYSSGFLRPNNAGLFSGAPVSNKYYGQHRFMIMQDGDYYIKCHISASRDSAECKSYRFEIDLYGKKPSRAIGVLPAIPANKPTQYIGFAGDVIEYKGGKVSVDLHIQTTVAAKNGSTITLASGALGRETLRAGDAVGIESTTGAIQWTTLASAEGEVLTLSEPLADWLAVGDSVYISRLTSIAEYAVA